MANELGKFLGNLGGFAYERDSHSAASVFGLDNSVFVENVPRLKFQFLVKVNFNTNSFTQPFIARFFDSSDQKYFTSLVKSATLPSVRIKTETLNQYNRKRISQTKTEFEPVTLTFHDTVDGKTLRFWEMYYEYYFKDGTTSNKLNVSPDASLFSFISNLVSTGISQNQSFQLNFKDQFSKTVMVQANDLTGNFGYNVENVSNERYLIDSIEIYQYHYSRYSKTILVHPRITEFKHDTMSYGQSETMELGFTFEYEDVVYQNNYATLTGDELDYFRNADFVELSGLIRPPIPVRQRDLSEQTPFPPESLTQAFNSISNVLTGTQSLTDAARNLIENTGVVTQVQGSLDSVVGNIASGVETSLGSSSVFNSTLSFLGGVGSTTTPTGQNNSTITTGLGTNVSTSPSDFGSIDESFGGG